MTKIRLIAIHLPQFHPFEENNKWWGKGFTEWTNVAKAKPRFRGHYQPHLPSDTGFYDLRLPEARQLQVELAKDYGISGFCYYHYWFNGKRLMHEPLDGILASRSPDFPFMYCWANENWTRAWDGGEKEMLIKQDYSQDDDLAHIQYLLDKVFSDPRYIKIDGKPVFAIYRSTAFPDISKTLQLWRNKAKERGIELYICRFESFNESGADYLQDGFDAAIEFAPHNFMPQVKLYNPVRAIIDKIARKLIGHNVCNRVVPYRRYVEFSKKETYDAYKRFPGVTPMWDNSARRKKCFFAFHNSTPELYKQCLAYKVQHFQPYSEEENFIFINAWNEWAEGNHLEPDMKWGHKYLEATREALESQKK